MDTGKVPYCGMKEQCWGWDGGCDIDFDNMKIGLESMSSWISTLSFTVRGAGCWMEGGEAGFSVRDQLGVRSWRGKLFVWEPWRRGGWCLLGPESETQCFPHPYGVHKESKAEERACVGLITSVKTGPSQKITLTYPSPSPILLEQRNPKSFQPQPHLAFAPM